VDLFDSHWLADWDFYNSTQVRVWLADITHARTLASYTHLSRMAVCRWEGALWARGRANTPLVLRRLRLLG
jgi:hypothetical protein